MGTTATQEHPNATLIREGLEAFNQRDMQTYADLIADDIVWHLDAFLLSDRPQAAG